MNRLLVATIVSGAVSGLLLGPIGAASPKLPAPSNVPDLQPNRGGGDIPDAPDRLPFKSQADRISWRTVRKQTLDNWRPARSVSAKELRGIEQERVATPKGYFGTLFHRNRWWLLDPSGRLFLSAGVNTFRPAVIARQEEAFRQHFSDEKDWVAKETARLQSWGFNTAGCWSNAEVLREHDQSLAYTLIKWPGWEAQVGPLTAFSIEKGLGKAGTGNRSYKFGVMPVFHPDFPAFIEKHVSGLKRYVNDRRLLGYFLDNEIPHPELGHYLAASSSDAAHLGAREAAVEWLRSRGRTPDNLSPSDYADWPGYVFSIYCERIIPAMRKVDPHHLILGPRLYARSLKSQSAMAAVGKACDVVCVHPYGWVVPSRESFEQWTTWAGKPLIVSEWYAKGADTPFRNLGGAGILVPDQKTRGQYYQTFVMSCLSSSGCVGWHWHRYQDNDPQGGEVMASNRGENKGLVNSRFEAYDPCVAQMKQINLKMYGIAASYLQTEPSMVPWRAVGLGLLLAIAIACLAGLMARFLPLRRRISSPAAS